jgi:hypothetical protein
MEMPGEVRARFGWDESAAAGWAEGRVLRAAQLSRRCFNFGQHWRTEAVVDVEYALDLPAAFVSHLLARELPEFEEDAREHPSDLPLELALREHGWPDADRLLALVDEDERLSALVRDYFDGDLLLEWLGDVAPAELPGYVINAVDAWERRGDVYRLSGRARRAGQPVRYQDV